MGYQSEGEAGRETVWLVGGEVDTHGYAELKGLDGRQFGKWVVDWEVEREEETGRIGRWKVGCSQDVGRLVYPVKAADDKEKDVGMEGGSHMQTLEAFGDGFGSKIVGVEWYK